MSHLGEHYILELYGCDASLTNDIPRLKEMMLEAVRVAKATLVNVFFHQFSPQGVSGTIVIAESHFNIHTWPEHHFMAIDLFTCGDTLDATAAKDFLVKASKASSHEYKILKRGDKMKMAD